MVTSRTGTAKWKNLRVRVIHEARSSGMTRCPECQVTFNYDGNRTPDSPEVDHIVPASRGGQDTRENVRVICRRCNQSLGDKKHARNSVIRVVARVEKHKVGKTTYFTNGSSVTNLINW